MYSDVEVSGKDLINLDLLSVLDLYLVFAVLRKEGASSNCRWEKQGHGTDVMDVDEEKNCGRNAHILLPSAAH